MSPRRSVSGLLVLAGLVSTSGAQAAPPPANVRTLTVENTTLRPGTLTLRAATTGTDSGPSFIAVVKLRLSRGQWSSVGGQLLEAGPSALALCNDAPCPAAPDPGRASYNLEAVAVDARVRYLVYVVGDDIELTASGPGWKSTAGRVRADIATDLDEQRTGSLLTFRSASLTAGPRVNHAVARLPCEYGVGEAKLLASGAVLGSASCGDSRTLFGTGGARTRWEFRGESHGLNSDDLRLLTLSET